MPEVKVVITETNSELNVTEIDAEIILGTSGPQGAAGSGVDTIEATLPATWATATDTIGVDQSAFDYIGNLDYAQFDTTTTATPGVGKLLWNDTDGTLEFQLKGGNVTLQIGQEEVVRVRNNTGSPLLDGTAVYITSASSGHINVTKASNNTEGNSSKTLGILTENIANGQSGFCTVQGLVRNLNTSALTEGATIWLGTDGGLTTTRPTAPANSVVMGVCVVQSQGNATNGVIFVRVINGFELEELHNVLISDLANNQSLVYESSTQLWKNKTLDYSWLANIPSTFTPAAHASTHGSAGSDPVTVAPSQVSGTAVVQGDLATATVGTAGYATTAGTSVYATNSGTATYSTTSGTAAYATASGTAVYATTSGTAAYSTLSGTAAYATAAGTADTSGTASYSITSGTAVYATTSGTAAYSTTSGTASYATLAGQVTGTAILVSEKGSANGVATLDGSGLVPTAQIPPLAITDTFVVASEAAMLALTAEVGDVAIRTDVSKTFILQTSPASTLGNWKELLTPADGVTSIIASAPLTGGTITSSGTIGLDQTALAITAAQVSGTAVVFSDLATATVGTAGYATTAGTASYATTSGTAVYATTSGTASYATNAGASDTAGTATYSLTSGTASYATTAGTSVYATNSGTAVYATTSGTAAYATTSGTATYATNAGTSVYATNAGTAVYANNAGTATPSAHAASHGSAGSDAVTINKTQVTGTAVTLADTGTVTNTMLVNSSITLNGTAVSLGGSATISGGGGGFSIAPSFLTMGA